MDASDFLSAMDRIVREPQIVGYACSQDAYRYILTHSKPAPFSSPASRLMGTPIEQDAELDGETVLVFYDRDVWVQYWKWRRMAAHLRQVAPFRFQAYIDKGLIVQAQCRMLWDKQ